MQRYLRETGNTHTVVADANARYFGAVLNNQSLTEIVTGSKLCIETTTSGPLHITGSYSVLDGRGEPVYQGTDESFCRCGGLPANPSAMAHTTPSASSLSKPAR